MTCWAEFMMACGGAVSDNRDVTFTRLSVTFVPEGLSYQSRVMCRFEHGPTQAFQDNTISDIWLLKRYGLHFRN